MVVPLELDPGYCKPKSPMYRKTKADRERERKRQEKIENDRRHAEKMIEAKRRKDVRKAVGFIFD